MWTSSGAAPWSESANQSSVRSVSETRASSMGAYTSSGSPVTPRSWEARCSWCTVITRAGASSAMAAIRAGVVLTRMSQSSSASSRFSSTSESRLKVLSQDGLMISLGSEASVRHASAVSAEERTGRSTEPVRSIR
ncbi:hypothetical protein [Streptomyces sp. t39]|uniref:hypothetical protein n=1 Tax=Streptomyces sp. t39 TaxID=1828156 RepID=UPI0021C8A8A6|nr:hypothetical protein [Streptomyces sp. t39]